MAKLSAICLPSFCVKKEIKEFCICRRKNLLGHMGKVTSGLMIGIFLRFFFILLALEEESSLPPPPLLAPPPPDDRGSGVGVADDIIPPGSGLYPPSSPLPGLGGREPPSEEAAAACSKVDPLEILREAVGEGCSIRELAEQVDGHNKPVARWLSSNATCSTCIVGVVGSGLLVLVGGGGGNGCACLLAALSALSCKF